MWNDNLLLFSLLIPALGVFFIALFPEKCSRTVANLFCVIELLICSYFAVLIDPSSAYSLVVDYNLFGFRLSFGIDGLSLSLLILTAFLSLLCVNISRNFNIDNLKLYMSMFLLLEFFIVGAFISLNMFLFYVFFEAVLIPMFFIIGIWGGENRIYASFKLFLYTLLGSVFFLIAILYIYRITDVVNIQYLREGVVSSVSKSAQIWIWVGMFLAFAVKTPMWPVHTWLPDAHVQAPTAGSVILAGVLLKLGGYGMFRFCLTVMPEVSYMMKDIVLNLSIIAVVYTSVIALVQDDIKKVIAYSSVAHMGFVTAGLFSFNAEGVNGALFQMVSHGLVSAALFMCVGVLYDRMHTKKIADYGGIASVMPKLAVLFIFFSMASMGVPGTSGFVGEFLSIVGVFKGAVWGSVGIASGVVLGALYMLRLCREVIWSEVSNKALSEVVDLYRYEYFALFALAIFALLLGVFPKILLDLFSFPVSQLEQYFLRYGF